MDLKITVGETQQMIFQEDDPPPFYKVDAPRKDIVVQKWKAKQSKYVDVVVEGYEGKAKGMQQVLWERGLYITGMVKSVSADDKKGRGENKSMSHVLSMCLLYMLTLSN